MKIKAKNSYMCDKCGQQHSKENIASLSTNYQPTGLVKYGEGNLGVRHLCINCKSIFEKAFKNFFSQYNKTNENNRHYNF